jgi:hypothetical protein
MTQKPGRWTGAPAVLALVASALVLLAIAASAATAQDSSHVRRQRPQPPRRDVTADSILRDTTHVVHIGIDTARVDSSALDTLRRVVIRDSARAALARDSAKSASNCEGRRILRIDIRTQPPDLAIRSSDPRIAHIARRLNALHTTTRASLIRRFLAFRAGDVCTEERRTESERLLRAQPFIERARISAIYVGPHGVRLDVFTVDALAGEGALGVEGRAPLIDLVNLGNGNLLGTGIHVDGQWSHAQGYRDQWMCDVTDYQVLGRPWVANMSADLNHVGGHLDASLSHPYFTNLQRIGWRIAGGSDQDYVAFRRPGGNYPALDLQRTYANAGALFRIGNAARFESAGPTEPATRYSELALVGVAMSHEIDGIGGSAVDLTSSGPLRDTTVGIGRPPFGGRYPEHNVRRINGLAGFRAVRYLTVRGFDALLGEEDVPIGLQASGVAGHSIPWFGESGDPDTFASARMDVAAGTTRSIVQGGMESEARRDMRTGEWDGLLASGHAGWYLKPSLTQTVIVTTDAALGQRVRIPFQLALGDPQGGVEGYGRSQVAGGARVVGRAEYRHLFRMPIAVLRDAAWGLAAFATTGRIWAGDVPFGVTSPIVAGLGAGLLVGVPKESRQLWRVDIAAPLVPQPHSGWELRVSTSTAVRVWWTEPQDVTRSREQTVTPALFSYP